MKGFVQLTVSAVVESVGSLNTSLSAWNVEAASVQRMVFFVVLGVMLAGATAFGAFSSVGTAHASAELRYVRGYSVQGSWLCYGWSNWSYHCTQHWYRSSSGVYVSLNSPFVPSQSQVSSQPTAYRPPAPSSSSGSSSSSVVNGVYNSRYNRIQYCGTQAVDFSNASAWAVPHGCYGHIFYPSSSLPRVPSWGWCNMVPELAHINYSGTSVLGLYKHYGAPRVGAVIWYNPGVQGASSAGHWGLVVAIGPNGWMLTEEANFYYRGGGFDRIDYRFVKYNTGGVAFLYA